MTPFAAIIQPLTSLITQFWWLFLVLVLLGLLKSPVIKGVLGEFQVNLAYKLFLDKRTYSLFKNVTLTTEGTGTTQIDHIIVSRYGVFVIETKNMKGWIFGSPQQKMWTQTLYRHKTQFQNPLHQNYKHVKTLQAALQLEDRQIFSLVVFVGDGTFKSAMPDNVVYIGGYIRYIKSQTDIVLADTDVVAICAKILSERLSPSLRTHSNHVKHVKTLVEQKQQRNNQDNACPRCGSAMVVRTTKSGTNQGKTFFGCSNYPRCRMVKQIEA